MSFLYYLHLHTTYFTTMEVQNTTVETVVLKMICVEAESPLPLSCLAIVSCSSLPLGNIPPTGGRGAAIASHSLHGSPSTKRTVFKFGARSIMERTNNI